MPDGSGLGRGFDGLIDGHHVEATGDLPHVLAVTGFDGTVAPPSAHQGRGRQAYGQMATWVGSSADADDGQMDGAGDGRAERHEGNCAQNATTK